MELVYPTPSSIEDHKGARQDPLGSNDHLGVLARLEMRTRKSGSNLEIRLEDWDSEENQGKPVFALRVYLELGKQARPSQASKDWPDRLELGRQARSGDPAGLLPSLSLSP